MRWIKILLVFFLAMLGAFLLASRVPTTSAKGITVTLNPNRKYQTIRGWSCNPHYLGASPRQLRDVLDDAVNELGLTRIRWQQPNGNRSNMRRWEWENDNGDPDETDYSKLNAAPADEHVVKYILPFKRRVEANGDPFELWLSPSFFTGGSTGDVPEWMFRSPGEYAENAVSFILYLKRKYGIEPTHYVICNEASNHNRFQPPVVLEMTKVLGARMKALGIRTKGQFPEGINARVTWRYIEAARNDPDFWPYIEVLSYHWYGRNNQEWMAKIRNFARARGKDTAQTEFMHLTIDHLYEDLTIGGVAYWSIYGLGGPSPRGQNYYFHLNGTSFRRGRQFWNFRQVMHYVRPGAVRIEARASAPALRVLAFQHRGRTTVVLLNTKPPQEPRRVTIRGLPPGEYGVCYSQGAKPYREVGVRTVGRTGGLTIEVPANAVLTVYPHPGRNLPPTTTTWGAEPNYLKFPASEVSLFAIAQDPEIDRLSYSWSVTSQPRGANVRLTRPNSATTRATGLTVPGEYVFTVSVCDGKNTVRREVALRVFRGNQPPRPIDVHNRIPVLVTLPQSTTELRGGAHDLEGDKLTYRWSVVRQPRGAAVRLETPNQPKCKVTNLTVPGEYVFKFTVSDGANTVSEELTVPVYPVNTAPVIESIKASPSQLRLPNSSTTLSAVTRDPDGDVITHWWRVKRKPGGAKLRFSKQGGRATEVRGLTVPGVYVFALTVVDRTKFVVKEIAVTVSNNPARR